MDQAVSPTMNTGNFTVAKQSGAPCSEVTTVIRSVARAITFSPMRKVKSVQVMEGAMGSSSAINIELQPGHRADDILNVSALAKSTLLILICRSIRACGSIISLIIFLHV